MFLWSRWHVLGDSGRHSGIVRDDGEAVGFGCNEGGQCHVLPGPAGTHHVATAAGACHSILVRDAGESVEFGYNRYGQGDELARAVRGALARESRLGTARAPRARPGALPRPFRSSSSSIGSTVGMTTLQRNHAFNPTAINHYSGVRCCRHFGVFASINATHRLTHRSISSVLVAVQERLAHAFAWMVVVKELNMPAPCATRPSPP